MNIILPWSIVPRQDFFFIHKALMPPMAITDMTITDMIITDILAQNSVRYADKTAIVERIPAMNTKKQITWNEFYKTSCRFANSLKKKVSKKGIRWSSS